MGLASLLLQLGHPFVVLKLIEDVVVYAYRLRLDDLGPEVRELSLRNHIVSL